MVMADQALDSTSTDPKKDPGVPLDEVLGEAEARFGPMPDCLRSVLLPLPPHPLVSTTITTSPASIQVDSSKESDPMLSVRSLYRKDDIKQTEGIDHEGGIALDNNALASSSSHSHDSNLFDNAESRTKSDTIFLGLDDDYVENARRSPDSGCSMSEASAEDKISIASTVSASSDDGGLSRLGNQIQRLRQAMRELREQDVALARQLLVVYDYVEETKWFLENFEACDPRHSIAGPLTSTERRFSQNFQKRMSDFGIKGIPHSGFATPPSWTDLSGVTTNPKRHSRNISDGMISIENLRRFYHENNNNATTAKPGIDKSESCEALPDGPISDGSVSSNRSPRSMTRRSISSNFLEISFSSTTSQGDHCLHQGPLSPISDSGQAVIMDEDADSDDDDEGRGNMNLQSTPKLPQTNSSGRSVQDSTVVVEERTRVPETVSFYIPHEENQSSVASHSASDHHRGSASSSSASSMMPPQSCSSRSKSTDACAKSNSSKNTTEVLSIPPLSSTTGSLDPTEDDCSIFIADDSNDHITDDNRYPISSFESHMNWLQEQDETLL